jgi:hypothetical protein
MILIAAKGGCQSRRVTPTTAEKGELLLADVPPGIRLMAAYFPQGKAKAPFFEICIKEAISSQGAPLLFLGDVNTGHNKVDIEGRSVPFTGAEIFAALTTEDGVGDRRSMDSVLIMRSRMRAS